MELKFISNSFYHMFNSQKRKKKFNYRFYCRIQPNVGANGETFDEPEYEFNSLVYILVHKLYTMYMISINIHDMTFCHTENKFYLNKVHYENDMTENI